MTSPRRFARIERLMKNLTLIAVVIAIAFGLSCSEDPASYARSVK